MKSGRGGICCRPFLAEAITLNVRRETQIKSSLKQETEGNMEHAKTIEEEELSCVLVTLGRCTLTSQVAALDLLLPTTTDESQQCW